MDTYAEIIDGLVNKNLSELEKVLTSKFALGVYTQRDEGLSIIRVTSDTNVHDREKTRLRGLIFDSETLDIIAPPISIPIDDNELIRTLDYEVWAITDVRDSVTFRVYKYNDSWYASTNNMIHPNKGWNNSVSFMEMFDDAVDFDYESLDPQCCHVYELCHVDHRSVVKHSETTLTKIKTINLETHEETSYRESKYPIDTPIDEIIDSMNEIDVVPVREGYVGTMIIDTRGNQYRINSKSYVQGKMLMDNNSDPRYIWASYILDEEKQEEYLRYFPWNTQIFVEMSNLFKTTVQRFYSEYGKRFKQGKYIIHHSRHVKYINEINNIYIKRKEQSSPSPNITKDDIEDYLKHLNTAALFYVLNVNNQPSSHGISSSKYLG